MKKANTNFLRLEPFKWKKLIQYFLQGLLILAPIAITIYSMYWIVSTVDNWLPIFREPVRDLQGNIIKYQVKKLRAGFCDNPGSYNCYWIFKFVFYSIKNLWPI
jgi:TRAP-type C4-dicarboxylate transport system permease small subunit